MGEQGTEGRVAHPVLGFIRVELLLSLPLGSKGGIKTTDLNRIGDFKAVSIAPFLKGGDSGKRSGIGGHSAYFLLRGLFEGEVCTSGIQGKLVYQVVEGTATDARELTTMLATNITKGTGRSTKILIKEGALCLVQRLI